ncbi:MAG: HlyD family efflux transporter periplasmic adaptor subunit [Chloroflexaceae bacterium]|nr:HlyD family efflux transporter periplasmic adaptor subunit [Chloroflexaceae bacterium]
MQAQELLAILDVRSFDQNVRDAEAALVSARADQLALTEPASAEEVRAAQASVAQAAGNLAQAQGSVTEADIAAARASLNEAIEALNDLQDGTDDLVVQSAQLQIDEALVNLQTQRDQLSQAKTQAEIGLITAAEQVQSAQTDYSAAYWDWRYVQDYNRAPPTTSNPNESLGPELSDHSEQAYRDRLTQTEIGLAQAEANLQAAEKQVEQARLDEINGIRAAEERVRQAENNLAQVVEPAEAAELASARARVANAQANLDRLTGLQRQGQIASAQAGVANAQANLDRLTNPNPTESQQERVGAGITRAEANLERAQLNREYAELRAPFGGEIAVINIDPGDAAPTGGGTAAMRLVDLSTLYVEVNVSDADIARVDLGQEVAVVADALPDREFAGEVVFISPTSRDIQGVTNYLVRVELTEDNIPLRVGMRVTATIDVEESN